MILQIRLSITKEGNGLRKKNRVEGKGTLLLMH